MGALYNGHDRMRWMIDILTVPDPIRDNISIPIIVGYIGMQAILFFIPIVLIECVVAILLFNYAFKIRIKNWQLLSATILSNLFSTVFGFFLFYFILFGNDMLDSNFMTDNKIGALITLMVISVILEFPVLWLMTHRYLKGTKTEQKEKDEQLPLNGKEILFSAIITCFLQNLTTYALSGIIIVTFGLE
jgi:hypothetical protein